MTLGLCLVFVLVVLSSPPRFRVVPSSIVCLRRRVRFCESVGGVVGRATTLRHWIQQSGVFSMTRPNHALQRTRRGRRGCNRGVPCAGSLSFCR